MTARRRRLSLPLAVGATLALAGCGGETDGSSEGGCEAPRVVAEQAEASPGERLEISGTGAFETTLLLPENLGTDPIRITAPEVAGTETLVLSIRGS